MMDSAYYATAGSFLNDKHEKVDGQLIYVFPAEYSKCTFMDTIPFHGFHLDAIYGVQRIVHNL